MGKQGLGSQAPNKFFTGADVDLAAVEVSGKLAAVTDVVDAGVVVVLALKDAVSPVVVAVVGGVITVVMAVVTLLEAVVVAVVAAIVAIVVAIVGVVAAVVVAEVVILVAVDSSSFVIEIFRFFCVMQLAPSPFSRQLSSSAILDWKQLMPSPHVPGGQDPHWKYQALAAQLTPG